MNDPDLAQPAPSLFDDADARLEVLVRLGAALRPIDGPAELAAAAVRILGPLLRADHVVYAESGAGGKGLDLVAEWIGTGSPRSPTRIDHLTTELLADLCAGEVSVRTHCAATSLTAAGDPADTPAGTRIGVPLTHSGELRAAFVIDYNDPRRLADRDVDLIRAAADHVWAMLDAAQSRARSRASEARLAATLESVPVGVALLDTGGRILLANSEYRQFLPHGVIPSHDPATTGQWQAFDADGGKLAVRDYPGARAMRGERTVPGQEMLYQPGRKTERWTRVASVPIYDEAGRINGQASVISDIDALKRGSAALHESRARAQLLIDGIAEATWEATADGLVETDSPSWRAYTGQSYDEWKGFGWLDAVHPDDRAATFGKWRAAVRDRRAVDAEYRLRGRNGDYRWMNVRAVPFHDDAGRLVKWLGMNIDIDERKRLEQAVQDNERRTRALIEGVPQLLWRAIRSTEWSWVSPQWTAYTGQSQAEAAGQGWLAMVHPDDQDATLAAGYAADGDGGFEVEHRLRSRDGRYRWFSSRAVPVRDEDDRATEWFGTANDIDALRQAQGRQDVLLAELQHRTRNLIAVIRSLAEKTIDRASSLDAFEQRFNDRLSALSRVQGLLSEASSGRKVAFDELLRSELLALGAIEKDDVGDRVTLRGPRGVPLRSGAVQTLALALHELATNSAKYGALADDRGALDVCWSAEGAAGAEPSLLLVEWREHGLTLPDIATRSATRGYGRELIERALPYQLGADTNYVFTEDGLCCTIKVPIVSMLTEGKIDD